MSAKIHLSTRRTFKRHTRGRDPKHKCQQCEADVRNSNVSARFVTAHFRACGHCSFKWDSALRLLTSALPSISSHLYNNNECIWRFQWKIRQYRSSSSKTLLPLSGNLCREAGFDTLSLVGFHFPVYRFNILAEHFASSLHRLLGLWSLYLIKHGLGGKTLRLHSSLHSRTRSCSVCFVAWTEIFAAYRNSCATKPREDTVQI